MSDYSERLHNYINRNGFVRSFYGKCPECGKRVFSVGDDVVDFSKVKAKFLCPCGKKWKEVVYSRELNKYKYPQALVEEYRLKGVGLVKVLKLNKRIYYATKDKVLSKEV